MSRKGVCYLVPVPLGESSLDAVLPVEVLGIARRIDIWIAENAKTARSMLKNFGHPKPIREITITELNEHTPQAAIPALLRPALDGFDIGLMSEAGCPAVADPGSAIVHLAHEVGVRVIPLVGPSSILLALMASGMNGQSFSFHGYLPAREPERLAALKRLENESRQTGGVQIFIETPYRTIGLFEACTRLSHSTRLCVARDLTLETEWIRSATIGDWIRSPTNTDLHRRPVVFLLQAIGSKYPDLP